MPAISTLTYTINRQVRTGGTRPLRRLNVTVAFGDGALTYPSGGVALTKASLGCPVSVENIVVEDGDSTGIVWTVDKSTLKLRAFLNKNPADAGGADIPLPEAGTSFAPAASSLNLIVEGY